MARTPSTMLDLGTTLPEFTLPDAVGNDVSTADIKGEKGTLVMFICNHCPFVKHVERELARLGDDYQPKGIGVVAIMPNDVETYPDDAPSEMAKKEYPFPYLYDASQRVAKDFRAACTPDFYLFDAEGSLVYRGQLDASRPGNEIPVTGQDLRVAMDALLEGGSPSSLQFPSLGCNIKWRKGNEPEWFG